MTGYYISGLFNKIEVTSCFYRRFFMAYEINGNSIGCNKEGYLEDINDWSEDVAKAIAATESILLEERHWDVISYLRDEYINNAGNQPNMRTITKEMKARWNDKSLDTKSIYDLFPMGPSKQAGKIAGLPESKRKGGY
jgi:tRNA 2-thiouridine synthesizing protein E